MNLCIVQDRAGCDEYPSEPPYFVVDQPQRASCIPMIACEADGGYNICLDHHETDHGIIQRML